MYTITLEAPGMEQKDLSIELKDSTLYIKGKKQQKQEEKDKNYYRVERHYGSFERVLANPDDGNADEIEASMKNGKKFSQHSTQFFSQLLDFF